MKYPGKAACQRPGRMALDEQELLAQASLIDQARLPHSSGFEAAGL